MRQEHRALVHLNICRALALRLSIQLCRLLPRTLLCLAWQACQPEWLNKVLLRADRAVISMHLRFVQRLLTFILLLHVRELFDHYVDEIADKSLRGVQVEHNFLDAASKYVAEEVLPSFVKRLSAD